jgi:hypothetical protein
MMSDRKPMDRLQDESTERELQDLPAKAAEPALDEQVKGGIDYAKCDPAILKIKR